MPGVKDFIYGMDYEDLIKLKKDIVEFKGLHLTKLVEERLKEIEKEHDVNCANCMTKIDPENINNFTLIFGPASFRKKATFCGTDCMEYFLAKLKKIKSENIQEIR